VKRCYLVFVFAALAVFCCLNQATADVLINEFMAKNNDTYPNGEGKYYDWIELYNDSTGSVDLTGWYLTDDNEDLPQWQFPAVILDPYEFLVVFASNKDLNDPAEELHTNFKLTSDGEYLALVSSNGVTVMHEYSPNFPEQFADVSYGVSTNETHEMRYFATPTPGSTNTGGYLGTVGDTKFSLDRGFYSNVIHVAITTATESASIRYTLDGSMPTEVYGTLYSTPITITNTTPLRAMAYRTGYKSTDVDTQTYVFLSEVLKQPPDPDGFPSSWGSEPADYEVDPEIVNDPLYSDTIISDLKSIPTMSLVMGVDDMFGANGIYTRSNQQGLEEAGSLEMFYPEEYDAPDDGFQLNCGVRIYGGVGRNPGYKKHAFRILFKGIYGPTKLEYPLFDDDAADRFDTIILRHNFNDGFVWGGNRSQYIRDEYVRRLQMALGEASPHGTFVHLYINGLYWGLYNPVERPDQSFGATYYGGDKENWDAVNSGAPTGESDTQEYGAMMSLCRLGMTNDVQYQLLQGNNPDGSNNTNYPCYLDIPNYINYLLVNFFTGNSDWPGHNWYAARQEDPGSTGYKAFCWDSEWSVGMNSDVNRNMTGVGNSICEPYKYLRENAEFSLLFGDLAYKAFYNGGPFYVDPDNPDWDPAHPERNRPAELYKWLADWMERSMVGESARWGDVRSSSPYDLEDWRSQRDWILNTYMPQRAAIVVGQLRSADLYPSIDPPEFNQHGGLFTNGFELIMTASDPVYYTLDGSDPREYGTGSVTGTPYAGPMPLAHAVRVKARARSAGGEWSALHEALFVPDWPSSLRVSEVMYNPRDPEGPETNAAISADAFEFIEIQNTGITTSGLAGTEFTDGIDFDFESGDVQVLAPGESAVIVSDLAAFTNRYTNWAGMRIAGEYDGSLNDGGERVMLRDAVGSNIVTFTYNDGRGWPPAADGAGHSLVPLVMADQLDDALDYGGNWRAGTYMDGSPGEANPAAITNVLLNEITAHTDTGLLPPLDSDDWIELFNTTPGNITLDDWYLSDSAGDLMKWQIPATNVIDAAGWLTFTERNGFNPDGTNGFGINKAGEQVFLSHMPGGDSNRVVDCVRFKGQENGRSLGKYADGETYWYALTPTTNAANAAPVQEIVISEIMFHPPGTEANPEDNSNDEYVEILNVSGGQVDLWNGAGTWRLDGKSYTFPSNVSLAADSSLLVVSFDPANSIELTTFLNVYGLTNGEVQIFGPYSGKLSNRGERIAVERPQAPDIPGDPVSWVIVDEVIYFDRAPWPLGADATGRSLERTEMQRSGNDPANWQVGFWASPGTATPVFRISSPGYGDTLLLNSAASVQATVDVSRIVGSVDNVEFFLDGSSTCVDTTQPYECAFGPITNEGGHVLSAVMADDTSSYRARDVVVIGSGVNNEPGATSITFSTAELGGSFRTNAQASAYIYWGPDDGVTDKGAWSNEIELGTQRGSFAAPVYGLRSCETYYYRCYGTNAHGDAWAGETTNLLTDIPPVSLSLSGSPFSEDGGIATVTATLGNLSASNATVYLSFSGDAVYGVDYSASATTIVINAGTSSGLITLTGLNDPDVEDPESAIVSIHSTVHAAVGTSSNVTASVISNDPMVDNGGGATGVTDASATLNGNLVYGDIASIYIYWGTEDGGTNMASWGTPRSLGSLGEGPFSDSLNGLLANQTYYYRCYAENAAGGDWADSTTNFTTGIPSVSIPDIVVTEGDSGSRDSVLTVVLSAPSGTDVSVNYSTDNGTALAGSDYESVAGTLVIDAGDPSGQITVPVNGDADSEWPSEDFYVDLDTPTNCTIADSRSVVTISDDDVDVYLFDWKYRMKITFDGYGKNETLDDFPALVVLNTNRENFAYSQFQSGMPSDLRFANSNLTSLLYYEIEDWNTNGDSVAWVQVPGVLGTNTYIWAYWGNPDATNQPAYTTNGAAWNSGYRGVWHVNDAVIDSTSNGNDATADSSVSTEGAIAGGKRFNGSNQAITLGDLEDFDLLEDLTLSAWVKPDPASSGEDCMFGKWGNSYIFSLNNRRPRFYIDGWRDANSTLTGADWDLVTVTYDDGNGAVRFYVNGKADGSHTYNQNSDTSGTLYLGRRGGDWFQGDMDEFRMSDTVRSSNWVWACWMNTASNDAFNLYGDVEAADEDAPSIFNVYGATNVTDTSAYLTARLTSTGTAETAVWVYWGTEDSGETATNWANTNYFGPVPGTPSIDYATNVQGLVSNSYYYYAYMAANSMGTNWASGEFTTFGAPALDTAGGATNIDSGTAELRGTLLLGNEATVTIYWGPFDHGTNRDAWADHAVIGPLYGNGSEFSTSPDGLLYGLRYYYRCYATNDYGEGWSPPATFLTLSPMGAGAPGLTVRLFDTIANAAYLDPISVLQAVEEDGTTNQVGDIDYSSFADHFLEITDNDNLTILWEGFFRADEDATYTFGTSSDDGSMIYLDLNGDGDFDDAAEDETVVDNNGSHGVIDRTGEIALEAGEYPIAIGFFQGTGGYYMGARWKKGSGLGYSSLDFIDGTSGVFFQAPSGIDVGITDAYATNVTTTTATLGATLSASGSVYYVSVHWGDENRGTNDTWDHSEFLGFYSDIAPTDLSHVISNLNHETLYYYTFRATNAAEDAWVEPSQSFTTFADMAQWARRMQISFTNYPGGPLTNFPALVRFSGDMIYEGFASTNGHDLRFAREDGITLVNYEVEDWNPDGESAIWVQVPLFTNNCHIWAYWGNASAIQPAYTTNGATWDSGYKAVWHLGETDALAGDATINSHDSTYVNGLPGSTDGRIGAANDFVEAEGDYIWVPASDDFDVNDTFTVSAWVLSRANAGDEGIVGTYNNGWILSLSDTSPNNELSYYSNNNNWQRSGSAVPENSWTHVAVTFQKNVPSDSTDGKFYINGAEVYTFDMEDQTVTDHLTIGAGGQDYSDGEKFQGVIDEVRICDRTRSSDWLLASYSNQCEGSTFVTLAPVSVMSGIALHSPGVSNVLGNSADAHATLAVGGDTNAQVTLYWKAGSDPGETHSGWDGSNDLGTVLTGLVDGATMSGLSGETLYYYRFYATNSVITNEAWSSVGTFTTRLSNPDYTFKMQISFTNHSGSPLTNFPALVRFNEDNDFYDEFASSKGYDLRFTSEDGTVINYEIESWKTNGESCVWVQVPLFTNNCYTWAYWGNSSPNGLTPPGYTTNGAVWDADYVAVWHLSEDVTDEQTDGIHRDSTLHDNDGSQNNNGPTNGVVGGGQDFDTGDWIDCGNSPSYDAMYPDAVTISGWAYLRGDYSYPMMVTRAYDNLAVRFYSNSERAEFLCESTTTADSGDAIPENEWHHVVATFDTLTDKQRIYIDGQLVKEENRTGTMADHRNNTLYLGRRSDSYRYGGLMDEVRLSSIARSSDWIQTCWMNQVSNDTFTTFGDIDVVNPIVPRINNSPGAADVTSTSALIRATLTSTGTAPTEVWCYWGTNDSGTNLAWTFTNSFGFHSNAIPAVYSFYADTLEPGTVYYYAFQAANSNGMRWARPSAVFKTIGQPEVNNGAGAVPGIGWATLTGQLTSGTEADVTVYWGASDGGTNASSWAYTNTVGTLSEGTSFATNSAAGLLYGLAYYYRCYAVNEAGEDWADDSASFTTLPPSGGSGGSGSTSIRINSSYDDAEESNAGVMDLISTDLELVYDGGDGIQHVGMCFDDVTIPEDVTITNAYIQFKVDETDTADVIVTIRGEATGNASTFGSDSGNISSRDLTTASTNWSPAPWSSAGAAGVDQRTPDLTGVIMEIIDRPDWSNGNSLAVIITGTEVNDKRTAESWNGDASGAAALYISWATNVTVAAISNAPATDITTTSATFNAFLQASEAVFDVNVYWGTSDGGDDAGSWSNTNFIGSYTNIDELDLQYAATGLTESTVYYYTFSASNTATNEWPASERFSTVGMPLVTNGAATGVTTVSATMNGELLEGGSAAVTLYWGTTDAGTNHSSWLETNSWSFLEEGAFSLSVTGLPANQAYYYRCYATNAVGDDWADSSESFTTDTPVITVGDVTLVEGHIGSTAAVFVVSLSATSAVDVSFDYATGGGTAQPGTDYLVTNGTLTMVPGETSGSITVMVTGDTEDERPFNTFDLNLSSPSNCTLSATQATCRIDDDDIESDAWRHKMKVTFSGYEGSDTLTNFPALVVLSTNLPNFLYNQFGSDTAADLLFANAYETDILNHEIEQWNTNGESYVWVRVPELEGTNTYVWAYWGNAGITNPPPYSTNGATWSEQYEGVWHFADTGSDSSSNASHGALMGDPSFTNESAIGPALDFDGIDDYVDVEDGFADFSGGITVSAWVRVEAFQSWARIVDFGNDANVDNFFLSRWSTGDGCLWDIRDGVGPGANSLYKDDVFTLNRWQHVAATIANDASHSAAIYLDGQQVATGAVTLPRNVVRTRNYIGESNWTDDGFHEGQMDEVRISTVARSWDWIRASWLNQASNAVFVGYGDIESETSVPYVINNAASDITVESASFNGTMISTGEAPADVTLYWGETDGGTAISAWANTNTFGVHAGPVPGLLTTNITGLSAETTYYYRFYATNALGPFMASPARSFQTHPHRPVVENRAATGVDAVSASLNGALLSEGSAPAETVVFWGLADGGTVISNWTDSHAFGTNTLEVPVDLNIDIDELIPKTAYYYRFYATNDFGAAWADSTESFVTTDKVELSLVASGSEWRYQDDGTAPGAGWEQPGFDDSGWPVGAAPFGFGEGDEATTNTEGYVAYYYRHTAEFTSNDVAFLSEAALSLVRDDGAVVYINGTEIGRNNMPTGIVDHLTTATNAVEGEEEGLFIEFDVDPSVLTVGTNVIAVEIHQVSSNSVDCRFELVFEGVITCPSAGFHPLPDVSSFTLEAAYPDLPGLPDDDHSGCALVPSTGELLAILNKGPTMIRAFDYAGTLKREIALPDWDDTEGMCLVDAAKGEYAIVEEDLTDITIVTIATNTTSVSKSSGQTLSTGLPPSNYGLEGASYDRNRECFYAVKEKEPMSVYKVSGTPGDVTTELLFDAQAIFSEVATDLSDIFYDERTDHLLILSDESNRVFECDMSGNILASLSLPMTQPEGLVLSADNKELHVVGEPNQYYRYTRPWLDRRSGEGTNVSIEVMLSAPWMDAVSVDYIISSDAAVFGSDYTNDTGSVTGSVVFAPGSTSAMITVEILDDWEAETNEVLLVTLSDAAGAVLGVVTTYHHTILGGETVPLTVSSDYGTTAPPVGTNAVRIGRSVDCVISDSPVVNLYTQLVCAGWTGSGDIPGTGTGTNTGFLVITNDSVINWNWTTNYWLGVEIVGSGTVTSGDTWYALGTNVTVRATNALYFTFANWSGDVEGAGDTNQPELTVPMNRGRLLTATFTANLASNNTPEWWLADHYWHTNDFNVLAMSDTDNDGMTAWEEHEAGTIPTNAMSKLEVEAIQGDEPFMVLHWSSVSNRIYSIWGSTNVLTNGWWNIESNIPAVPPMNTWTVMPASADFEYYRIGVERE
jgi:uncharacterized protein YjiK